MLTLLLLFALKVTTPGEMACVGSVRNMTAPLDLYIAGVEQEGMLAFATQGHIVYLNGPRISGLKPGMVQRVIRPEGKVHDPATRTKLGFYYRDIGTVQIETVTQEVAVARVISSCQAMLKGDLVVPDAPKQSVEYNGNLSNDLTVLPSNGLASTILLGKDDLRELAAGQFCFIGLGVNDGIKPGDRFIVFRPYPGFNSQDMTSNGEGVNSSYSRMSNRAYRSKVNELLQKRTLAPQILGDIIVVEPGDGISAGKIVNSLFVMHPGDFVVKK